MFHALSGDLDAFPPRLHSYLTALQTMLEAVLETKDCGKLLNLTHALEHAPRTIQNITVGAFADWVLQHHEGLGGPQSDAVQWAYRFAELIVTLGSATPSPSTAEVFANHRFDQLIADARGIFDNVPALVDAVRLASFPTVSEAVQ